MEAHMIGAINVSTVFGDGIHNFTPYIDEAIRFANASGKPLYFPPGTYVITPGALPDIGVSILAADAVFKAANNVDAALLTVSHDVARSSTAGGFNGYTIDIGGFFGSSDFSGAGTGLHVKSGARNRYIVRQGAWLKYVVHVDASWKTGAPMPVIVENDFWIKADSSTMALQISTNNDPAGVPIDVNRFYLSSSFNHTTALCRVNAGTTAGASNVQNNRFITEDLELGQPNSDGFVFNGLVNGNKIYIYNQRGINGTGKYVRADAHAGNNYLRPAIWVPANYSLGANWQIDARFAEDGANPQNGRSVYIAPDVSTAIGSTTPSVIGDFIWRSNPGIGDNIGWICTAGGTPGGWTEYGIQKIPMFGMTATAGVAASTTVFFPVSGSASAPGVNDTDIPCSTNGVLRKFRIRSSGAPGSGQTYTVGLHKNGGMLVNLVISDAATTQSNLSTLVSVAEGDVLSWGVTASDGAATSIIQGSFEILTAS
jgi:hypothetical protein